MLKTFEREDFLLSFVFSWIIPSFQISVRLFLPGAQFFLASFEDGVRLQTETGDLMHRAYVLGTAC